MPHARRKYTPEQLAHRRERDRAWRAQNPPSAEERERRNEQERLRRANRTPERRDILRARNTARRAAFMAAGLTPRGHERQVLPTTARWSLDELRDELAYDWQTPQDIAANLGVQVETATARLRRRREHVLLAQWNARRDRSRR